ncbi:MAG: GAF domain-containing protein, partial [Pseudomonadota bacterium]|nr:GAF domain-containing protein [Pseudomonadota bacterium]
MSADVFAELMGVLPEPMLLVSGQGEILAANGAVRDLLALPAGSLAGKNLLEIAATAADKVSQYLGACARSRQRVLGALALRGAGERVVDCRCEGCVLRPHAPAKPALILLRLRPKAAGGTQFTLLTEKINQLSKEILVRKQAQSLINGQKRVLELMVHDAPLDKVLAALIGIVENHTGGPLFGSVLLLDPDGVHLRHGAAPRLPESYVRAIDGIAIGPQVGSCGTAAYCGEMVVAADIATDPRWAAFRDLALSHGLRACWSTPIFARDGRVLGTFAIYHPRPCAPAAADVQTVTILTRIAAIAIERSRAEEERAQLLAREQQARQEAEAASRAKDEFLATVSHELRTPLQAVLGWTRLLGTRQLDDASAAHALETIERNVRSQAQLIEDILDFSRIISGRLRLDVRPVELVSVVEAAVDIVRPAAEAKRIRLEVVLDPRSGPVSGDPERLQQVLWNLLSNA